MIRPDPTQDLWIFAYGSLMWNPDFPYTESAVGLVHGYHRSLCILSTHYRGTHENPGLVLGLDRSGSCCGRAFLVASAHVASTVAYLDEREQVNKVYCPRFVHVKLSDGRCVQGYTFVVRHEHEQYVRLSREEQARLVAHGTGERGAALDYLASTVEHIDALGIKDTALHQVLARAKALRHA